MAFTVQTYPVFCVRLSSPYEEVGIIKAHVGGTPDKTSLDFSLLDKLSDSLLTNDACYRALQDGEVKKIKNCFSILFFLPEQETNKLIRRIGRSSKTNECVAVEDTYDVVPSEPEVENEEDVERSTDTVRPGEEYDEPWEWSVGARLTSSLQVSPSSPGALSLDTPEEGEEARTAASSESLLSDDSCDDEMTARQRRLYETAFDSRVKRDVDDLDRLMQSPDLFRNGPRTGTTNEVVTRAASRSSFGSTSGSSASSTPTHQPMVIANGDSPRQRHHFTPTERRKVTLIRDHLRSASPQARILANSAKISFSHHWDDNVSRCSSSDDKSSSQESMNVEKDEFTRNNTRNNFLLKSSSRDDLVGDRRTSLTANYPSNWKELTNARLLENSNGFQQQKNGQDDGLLKDDSQDEAPTSFVSKKPTGIHSGVKVLPTDNSRLTKPSNPKLSEPCQDPELKENNLQQDPPPRSRRASRPTSLLSDVRPLDNVPQSPDTDQRPSDDYDPPWEFKSTRPSVNGSVNVLRPSVNGSVSVPERLSQTDSCNQMTTSVTHDKLSEDSSEKIGLAVVAPKAVRPTGLSSRPNLNLNLNLNSDSPRKARQNLVLNFGCAALSAVGEKVDAELTLEKQGWYHGSISRLDAENLLRVLKEGSYLVRNSESSKQDYSLSLKSARGFMHMKIVHSEGRFILGQFSNPFSSIPEMIHHYSINKLPIKGAEHMSLLYPVIDQLL
ncbi:hypothetical protein JTE90_024452 [Oedothorax gibbosus]|uniref:SH2 domain-containing adapter protein D n=1 Tax=Oedothorax gibbosus TaxID=931172 RepID=A0AAV6UD47_9ARAC|nr:hypothetical protein JTE90_024452 [Oedothorax gibbosus]